MLVRKAIALAAVAFASVLVTIGPASADVVIGAGAALPGTLTVGQISPGSLLVSNLSTGSEGTQPLTVTLLRMTPSCGNDFLPCTTPDPGVFALSAAIGGAGTACAGTPFSMTAPDASGAVTFTPPSPVVLGPPGGPTDTCRIEFTLQVLRMPAFDSNPGTPGVQTKSITESVGNVSGFSGSSQSAGSRTVFPATPDIVTQANTPVPLGSPTSDVAAISFPAGSATPTGTVQFSLFGPDNATCTGVPTFVSTNTVTPSSTTTATATSSAFVPTQAGVYRFVASYSGDANYNPVTSACNDPNEIVVVTAPLAERPVADFDGNNITDVSVFRPSNGTWYLRTASPTAVVWGQSGDVPASGDYDGNGTTDVAVFRPSNSAWYLRTASPTAVVWGATGDIPVPGDYDSNGTTDVAVFRPSSGTWYLRTTSPTAVVWGSPGDVPVPGDYDGNGTTDLAVFRPSNSTWYLRTASPTAVFWGATGDIPVPGDYDGNGTSDVAVFRPSNGTWYLRTTSPTAIVWGQNGDRPEPGDYDGNGTTDLAVFRPTNGIWYLRTASPTAVGWGVGGDVPVPLPQAIHRVYFP